MSARNLYLSSLVLLAAAQPVHADAVADFKTGTAVLVEGGIANLGNGPRSSTGSGVITKPAGSLDFTLRASDLGVSLPIAIQLRGSVLRGGLIRYTVDQVYSPPVDLGAGHFVSSVTGRIYMRAVPLPGDERPEVGNVRLIVAGASSLVARTDLGDVAIAVDELVVQGGLVQPVLSGFVDPTTTLICSDRAPTVHAFVVSLTNVARGTGAVVQLTAPRDAGVHVPYGIVVRGGRRSATVRARIEPNFVGRVRLTALAGGVARWLDVDVQPAASCR